MFYHWGRHGRHGHHGHHGMDPREMHHFMREAMRGGGWGGHGFGGREGRGGGGRGRMFDGGELRLVLLKLIADEPRHGYDLIREIEALTQGAYAPSPGVIYPTLTLLADMGLIEEAQTGGAKKQFAITEAGTAYLAEHQAQVDGLIARLTAFGQARARADHGAVRRAVGNLHEVLRNKLATGEVDDEMAHQAVALIDEAAQKIERL